jgi:hypothetical protein
MSGRNSSSRIDGHRLTEFIYGTVVALVAISGIDAAHADWVSGLAVVVGGGVAIWLAHAYSGLMSQRITSGHRVAGPDIGAALAGSWPIVSAALLTALPLIGVAFGMYSMQTALRLASGVGVLILALVGVAAGIITQETWARRALLVVLSSGLGLLVVAIELAVHH